MAEDMPARKALLVTNAPHSY